MAEKRLADGDLRQVGFVRADTNRTHRQSGLPRTGIMPVSQSWCFGVTGTYFQPSSWVFVGDTCRSAVGVRLGLRAGVAFREPCGDGGTAGRPHAKMMQRILSGNCSNYLLHASCHRQVCIPQNEGVTN